MVVVNGGDGAASAAAAAAAAVVVFVVLAFPLFVAVFLYAIFAFLFHHERVSFFSLP